MQRNPAFQPLPFLSTLSLRRATLLLMAHPVGRKFLSTLSLRRATLGQFQRVLLVGYFYPRSPCGERRQQHLPDSTHQRISIHALLAESDTDTSNTVCSVISISIHALLAESDHSLNLPSRPIDKFLSTLSLRRATTNQTNTKTDKGISIHALLAESDPPYNLMIHHTQKFLSTLSLRRATRAASFQHRSHQISIHALLAESDPAASRRKTTDMNFYPRSPCGERPGYQRLCGHPTKDFYPRSPCGERLYTAICCAPPIPNFYPRSPCGERRSSVHSLHSSSCISIHALLAESDALKTIKALFDTISIHALLAESDAIIYQAVPVSIISIHALLAESDRAGCSHVANRHQISIHALLAESDQDIRAGLSSLTNFYPRSPCGERPTPATSTPMALYFYPRSPCGERHRALLPRQNGLYISIHALLAESDVNGICLIVHIGRFLSTLSLRRATYPL